MVFTPITLHTVGEATRTYPLAPEASKAANLDDFPKETFVNGVLFSAEDFFGDDGRATGADTSIGSVGIGGAAVGNVLDMNAFVAPTLRFRCISKSPTYHGATDNQSNKCCMYL